MLHFISDLIFGCCIPSFAELVSNGKGIRHFFRFSCRGNFQTFAGGKTREEVSLCICVVENDEDVTTASFLAQVVVLGETNRRNFPTCGINIFVFSRHREGLTRMDESVSTNGGACDCRLAVGCARHPTDRHETITENHAGFEA